VSARNPWVRAVVLAGVALALVACARPATPTPTPPALPAALPGDHVLLRVEEHAGMIGWQDASTPRRFVLTADGRLQSVVAGRTRLPAIRETMLAPDALAAAWKRIVASGVTRDGRLDVPGLFDAESTVFMADDGDHRTKLEVYGLGATGDVTGPGVPAPSGDAPARLAAGDLLSELTVLATGRPVEAPRLALYIAGAGDGVLPSVPWTGALDLASAGGPVAAPGFERCVVLDGDHASATAELARQLPADALVEQDGARWVLGFRPLFADEPDPEGCRGA
jgi:hypothetical protein